MFGDVVYLIEVCVVVFWGGCDVEKDDFVGVLLGVV